MKSTPWRFRSPEHPPPRYNARQLIPFVRVMLSPGDHLGPYEVLALLGAGGMGEVYRARDTRLGREVAVKVLPASIADDPARLKRFEREAKAVAALNHPNVLIVHDVGTDDGTAYLVTELLEGETLREHVSRRKVLPARAVEITLEVARGLDAAHEKGIVHRDIKPANVFVARDGRVKVLDFGLAKARPAASAGSEVETETRHDEENTSPGQLLGTVGYMSPEQVRGLALDGRSDVFSLGVVLYELLTRQHPFRRETEIATLTALLEEKPADVASVGSGVSPAVAGIVRRCLSKDRKDRYGSCRELIVALETALERPGRAVRAEPAEERSPYPGLSSFGEEDADRFFGREVEVEALWGRLRERRLLAVIGPSGAGKTSFVRAGVVASRPSGWAALVCTPGAKPLRNLGQALAPEVSSDADALRKLVGLENTETAFELLKEWRKGHGETLLVLDQFEELFTLNSPETQADFTKLLGRLRGEADIHVLLSLRDDFLIRCADHAALAPVFLELTPMPLLAGDALRRAVVEPASREGYRFEEDALIEEMLSAVEGARGALPPLAFAVSRLWEKRDREKKILTRAVYEEMGGVAGALAQHAEAVLERIGMVHQGLVREMFRNLVTAQGTRAVVEREELLSVFPEREAAEEVLETLIDARLLTSYEVQEALRPAEREGAGTPRGHSERDTTESRAKNLVDLQTGTSSAQVTSHHRVEIVHESLLTAWPRLVMWQAQEEEGAVLRDQLKQAAHLWDEKGRPDELLWTGPAYEEYRVWRSRYAGQLTASEEAFAAEMVERAGRQRRRRRIAAAVLFAAASTVAVVTSVLWARAEAEARRAEGSKLLALAHLERERYPTAALAWAIKSLELSDTPEARLFALGVLQECPTAIVVRPPPGLQAVSPEFSPDGEWLAVGGLRRILLLNRDGRPQQAMGDYPAFGFAGPIPAFSPDSNLLFSARLGDVRALSIPDGRLVWRQEVTGEWTVPIRVENDVVTVTRVGLGLVVRRWPLDGGEPSLLGSIEDASNFSFGGSNFVYREGRQVFLRTLSNWGRPIRVGGELRSDSGGLAISPDGRVAAAASGDGAEIHVWHVSEAGVRPVRVFATQAGALKFDDQGRQLAAQERGDGRWIIRVFDLDAPPGAAPLLLQRTDELFLNDVDFDPTGGWLAVGTVGSTSLWALDGEYPTVLKTHVSDLAFVPDGRTLLTLGDVLEAWPLEGEATIASRILYEPPLLQFPGIAVDPSGRRVALAGSRGLVAVLPVEGGSSLTLRGFSESAELRAVTFAEAGRLVAAAPLFGPPEEKVVRVWDLDSGAMRTLGPVPGAGEGFAGAMRSLITLPSQRHVVAGIEGYGLVRFDLRTGEELALTREADRVLASDPATGLLLVCRFDREGDGCSPILFDHEHRTSRPLPTHGNSCSAGAIDPSGTIVATGSFGNGDVRVGPASGEEPQVLVGHGSAVQAMAFSPDGRWLAVADQGGSIRIWRVPNVTRTPLHLRRHADLMDVLYSHTNLRAVSDETSSTGYRLEPGPFPGWASPPEW